MTAPDLYVFAISHYCEKARFGLDVLGIEYRLVHLPPGPHATRVEALGATGSSLPVLVVDGELVQGSSQILDWAERATDGSTSLACDDSEGIEGRLDDVAGVHARRCFYSEALVDQPESVLPMFLKGLPADEAEATTAAWGVIPQVMAQLMDLGPEQEQESRGIVLGELDWLDGLLADGRRYLVGDRFSRVDITAASLLAPLASPPEHPTYADLQLPPRIGADIRSWAERPIVNWVREIYRNHRKA